MSADGTAARRITSSRPRRNGNTDPAWSPDGRNVVFTRSSPEVGLILFLVAASGGEARMLTDGKAGNDSSPDWGPGGWIAFERSTSEKHTDLFLIRPDGSRVRRLTLALG
jgi:Tol biopolymer transport system component